MRTLLAIVIALTLSAAPASAWWITADGEQVGIIMDVQEAGLLAKTVEVQLMRGGMQQGDGGFGRTVWFTIERKKHPGLVVKVRDLMLRKVQVKVTYQQELIIAPWRSEMKTGNFFVKAIEELK